MIGRITHCLALGATLALIGGCSSVPKDEYSEALAENAELREKLAATQDILARSESDKEQLLRENRDLSADLERASRQPAQASGPGLPAGATTAPSDVILSVAGDVLFDSGRATLKADGRRELDRIARLILTQYPSNTIRVEGYTDSDPIRRSQWRTNERLSAERALVVEEYLVSRGIDNDRIYSAAFGPSRPKSSKAASRRVEIVILSR